jgi:signal transduction histidine kinase
LLAAAAVINALLPVSYFAADQAMLAWLSLEALRIWLEHGSARTLLGPAIHVGFSAVGLRGDHAAGYQAARRILTLGEAGGYEPDTSQARFLFAFLSCWFEPIENGVLAARQAREGLVAGGDLANAGYTYVPAVQHLLDCAPSLDACAAELEAGLAFMRRTRSEQMAQGLDTYRWLVGVLRGGGSDAAGKATPDRYAGNRVALFQAHVNHAVAAVIFGHLADLTRHSAAAMSLLIPGEYAAAVARVLRGLALAGQARNRHGDERGSLLSELDEVTEWLAARAADAPANFLHLLRLVEAERAWAAGDFRVAAVAFDAAQSEVAKRRRPWHQALITESAARFHLAHGIEHAGYSLLLQARRQYLEWGATAKVAQLDWAYPRLRPQREATAGPGGDAVRERAAVTTGTFDLLGILSASQALSSETNVERLHARVVQVLSAMTGATAVHLPLWSDERKDWLLPAPGSGGAAQISGKGNERAIPMSVLRYARRTGAPLIVDDATRDDRFARDPYFSDVPFCSLLAVPILSRGTLRAVLLLENRLIRGAFTAERLDAVKLIAGQLAVSLHNVHLYAEFRRIADEQAALRRVATLVARGVAPAAMFAAVAEEIATLIGADDTMIVRFEPDGEATVMGGHGFWRSLSGTRGRLDLRSAMASVQEMGRAARHDLRDLRWAGEATSEGSRHAVAGPIVVEGRVWGAIGAGSRHEPLPPDTEQRLADFTELVATAIANAASRNELTSSRMRIVAAADQARRRIERDLHDGAQQHLVSLALRIRAAQAQVPPELGALAAELDDLAAETADALDQLREIARGIHPAILAKGDLAAALRSLARRSPIPVELHVHTENRLPEHVDVSVYYLIAEALTNAAKYAGASLITITVEADAAGIADAVLRVTVHDDGVGGADYSRGTGLVGLKDRVEALGGRIRLDSPPGEGTSLRAELPLTDANRDVTSP